ncbi:MAG: insulinase family protein [Acholeplasmatales bacterium]|nr:insulinase family protein [Acholeplasmatales bacterium]
MDFVIKTDKFHRIIIKKSYVRKIVPKDQTIRHLLSYYQMLACEKYNTEALFNKYLGYAYDMRFSVSSQTIGRYALFTYNLIAVDPQYINDENYTIDTIKEAFNECIKPVLNEAKNNFDRKLFNRAYEIYNSNLLEDETDDDRKALQGAISTMFKGTIRDFNTNGSLNDLEKITCKKLYNYYLSIMNDENVSYIVGNVNEKEECKHTLTPKSDNKFKKRAEFEPIVYQDADTNQCYLEVIYDTNIYRDNNLIHAITLLNLGLGGTGNSKLFSIVREKYGLCYSISSSYLGASGIIIVSVIINKKNLDKTLQAIDEAMYNLLNDFNLEEYKYYLIETIESRKDNMSTYISDHFMDNFFIDSFPSKDEIDHINNVTMSDIKKAYKKLNKRLVYIYGGNNNE